MATKTEVKVGMIAGPYDFTHKEVKEAAKHLSQNKEVIVLDNRALCLYSGVALAQYGNGIPGIKRVPIDKIAKVTKGF